MKRGVLFLFAGIFLMSSCSSIELKTYRDAISEVCVDWGAGKQKVSDYMKDSELKYDGTSVMDYFLSDEGQVVTYRFENDGLIYSALIVREDKETSISKIFNDWDYLGSHMENEEGVMITSMVDYYTKSKKNMLATTFTVIYKDASYRIIGFAPIEN